MNGIICINKPQGYTSFDVVARIRGMSKTKRVGHSGTLDPLATGVLPIFIGNATKAIDLLPSDDKSYIASFKFGITTDTLDISGKTISSCDSFVLKDDILALLDEFRGEIEQIPPMYSAIKINGQRLYDLARQGKKVERKARPVTIFELELLDFDENTQIGRFEISCSKGTYIRTIISDIGDRLKVGGIMTELCRTKACGFTLDDCVTIEDVQALTQNETLESKLLNVDSIFCNLPRIQLNEVQTGKFKNGVKLDINRVIYDDIETMHRVYDKNAVFIGLANIDKVNMTLVIKKMFPDNN